MQKPYLNPYNEIAREDLCRLQTLVPTADYKFITSLRLRNGTMTTFTNLLFQKAVELCRQRGIESQVNQQEFEDLIANCVISDLRDKQPGELTNKHDPCPLCHSTTCNCQVNPTLNNVKITKNEPIIKPGKSPRKPRKQANGPDVGPRA